MAEEYIELTDSDDDDSTMLLGHGTKVVMRAGALDHIQTRMCADLRNRLFVQKRGALLAIGVGTGKTRTALSATVDAGARVLVIAPKSLLDQWAAEIVLVYQGGVSSLQYRGDKDSRERQLKDFVSTQDDSARIVLVTAATFRLDLAVFLKVPWSMVVIDEIHQWRQPETKTYAALAALPQCKLGLSATITLRDAATDLRALIRLVDPQGSTVASSLRAMTQAYVITYDKAALGVRDVPLYIKDQYVLLDPTEEARYRKQLKVLHKSHRALLDTLERLSRAPTPGNRASYQVARLRYTADLNTLRVITVYAPLSEVLAQVTAVNEQYRQLLGQVPRGSALWRTLTTEKRHKIESIYTNAPLSSKLRFVLEYSTLFANTPHPLLIFSDYAVPLKVLGIRLAQLGVTYSLVTGESSAPERTRQIARWKNGEAKLLLLTKNAGGVGLNLAEAHHAIFIDVAWDPQKEEQAIGRMNRRTQMAARINISRILVPGSFDIIRHKVHTSKKRQLDAALGHVQLEDGDGVASIYNEIRQFDVVYPQAVKIMRNPSLTDSQKRRAVTALELSSSKVLRNLG